MIVDLRYPNINGKTTEEQLIQTKLYLKGLVDQLNFALQEVGGVSVGSASVTGTALVSKSEKESNAIATFNDIKALIIKSADIVNAYYDQINTKLEGVYVAESDFGSYAEQTTQDILANSTSIQQIYSDIQAIITDIDNLEHSKIETNAYINSGLLFYNASGVPVYGLEIGQRNTIDGVEVFNKYARFTSDKLSFYDSNNNEVAYVSDRKLYITVVEVTGELIRGKLVDIVQTNGTIVTKWIQ